MTETNISSRVYSIVHSDTSGAGGWWRFAAIKIHQQVCSHEIAEEKNFLKLNVASLLTHNRQEKIFQRANRIKDLLALDCSEYLMLG